MRAVPPRPEERDAIATAYWRYWQQRHVGSDVTPEAPNSVDAAAVAGGRDVVALVVALAETAPSDDDARTLALGALGALVAKHWGALQADLGTAARQSARFRMALCSARGAAPSAAVDRLLAPQPCICRPAGSAAVAAGAAVAHAEL